MFWIVGISRLIAFLLGLNNIFRMLIILECFFSPVCKQYWNYRYTKVMVFWKLKLQLYSIHQAKCVFWEHKVTTTLRRLFWVSTKHVSGWNRKATLENAVFCRAVLSIYLELLVALVCVNTLGNPSLLSIIDTSQMYVWILHIFTGNYNYSCIHTS